MDYLERFTDCLDRWENDGEEMALREVMCAWLFGHLDASQAKHRAAIDRLRWNLAGLIVVAGGLEPTERWGAWRSELTYNKAKTMLSGLVVPKRPRGRPYPIEERQRAAIVDSYRNNPDLTRNHGAEPGPEDIDKLLADKILPAAAKILGWSIDLEKDVGFHGDSVGRSHRRRRAKK